MPPTTNASRTQVALNPQHSTLPRQSYFKPPETIVSQRRPFEETATSLESVGYETHSSLASQFNQALNFGHQLGQSSGDIAATVQAKADDRQGRVNPTDFQCPVAGGQALPLPIQEKMETAFSTSFADVRVYETSKAESIGAAAYTQGSHIYFAPGQYDLGSLTGLSLLGHELTHVVQQRAGRVAAPGGNGIPINADPTLEAEADRLGAKAARGQLAQSGSNFLEDGSSERNTSDIQTQLEYASHLGHDLSHLQSSHSTAPTVQLKADSSHPIQQQGYGYEDEEQMMSVWDGGAVGMTSPDAPMSIPVNLGNSSNPIRSNTPEKISKKSELFSKHVNDFANGFVGGGNDAISGVGSMLEGAWDLTGGWLSDPEESRQTWNTLQSTVNVIRETPSLVWEGIKAPYVEAWQEGRPAEAIGRGTFEALSMMIGTKGLDKLTKGSKAGKAVSNVDKVDNAMKGVKTTKKPTEFMTMDHLVSLSKSSRKLPQRKPNLIDVDKSLQQSNPGRKIPEMNISRPLDDDLVKVPFLRSPATSRLLDEFSQNGRGSIKYSRLEELLTLNGGRISNYAPKFVEAIWGVANDNYENVTLLGMETVVDAWPKVRKMLK